MWQYSTQIWTNPLETSVFAVILPVSSSLQSSGESNKLGLFDTMEDVQTDDFEPGIFVRALYDYPGGDPSALAFTKGAFIEVFTQLDTGWWDGVLGDERGWFPKNYVELLTQEEIDEHLASFPGHWELEQQAASAVASQSFQRYAQDVSTSDRLGTADDFWIPQVNASGQVR